MSEALELLHWQCDSCKREWVLPDRFAEHLVKLEKRVAELEAHRRQWRNRAMRIRDAALHVLGDITTVKNGSIELLEMEMEWPEESSDSGGTVGNAAETQEKP